MFSLQDQVLAEYDLGCEVFLEDVGITKPTDKECCYRDTGIGFQSAMWTIRKGNNVLKAVLENLLVQVIAKNKPEVVYITRELFIQHRLETGFTLKGLYLNGWYFSITSYESKGKMWADCLFVYENENNEGEFDYYYDISYTVVRVI